MPPDPRPVDLAVLTYGHHPELIDRCLNSLAAAALDPGVRLHVGLNEPSAAVSDLVQARLRDFWPADRYFLYPRSPQARKYPLMRQLLRLGAVRPDGIFVWFDDDSFVKGSVAEMLADLRRLIPGPDGPAVGVRQRYIQLAAFQRDWVTRQPWYTGLPIPERNVPLLPGSWWACPTALLLKHDWPPPDLVHNGGDILFSLLCAQQGVEMLDRPQHVAINADRTGRNCTQRSREPHPRTPRAGDPAWGKGVPHVRPDDRPGG